MTVLEEIAVDDFAFRIGAFIGAVAGILSALLFSVITNNSSVAFFVFLAVLLITWGAVYKSIR